MLIRNRRHLIPLFLYPSVLFVAPTFLPQGLVMPILFPLFFVVTIYGDLPYYRKQVPSSYRRIAMAVSCAGIVPALFFVALVVLLVGEK